MTLMLRSYFPDLRHPSTMSVSPHYVMNIDLTMTSSLADSMPAGANQRVRYNASPVRCSLYWAEHSVSFSIGRHSLSERYNAASALTDHLRSILGIISSISCGTVRSPCILGILEGGGASTGSNSLLRVIPLSGYFRAGVGIERSDCALGEGACGLFFPHGAINPAVWSHLCDR